MWQNLPISWEACFYLAHVSNQQQEPRASSHWKEVPELPSLCGFMLFVDSLFWFPALHHLLLWKIHFQCHFVTVGEPLCSPLLSRASVLAASEQEIKALHLSSMMSCRVKYLKKNQNWWKAPSLFHFFLFFSSLFWVLAIGQNIQHTENITGVFCLQLQCLTWRRKTPGSEHSCVTDRTTSWLSSCWTEDRRPPVLPQFYFEVHQSLLSTKGHWLHNQ